ncbi:MAG: hypothetical protein HKM06_07335, partial [Spirochaetales bacterium]|nr:hypothetical protein [Spirochaetales bacterium]
MKHQDPRRLVIIGAGFAGTSLAREIRSRFPRAVLEVFWDDDPDKIGSEIEGVPVLGPIAQIREHRPVP